jgi:hypothetical protein
MEDEKKHSPFSTTAMDVFALHNMLLSEHQKINYPILWDGHLARP